MKCLNRPQEGPATRPYFAYKIFDLGPIDPAGVSFAGIPQRIINGIRRKNGMRSGRRILTRGGRNPVSGFSLGAGKRGTWAQGAGV